MNALIYWQLPELLFHFKYFHYESKTTHPCKQSTCTYNNILWYVFLPK